MLSRSPVLKFIFWLVFVILLANCTKIADNRFSSSGKPSSPFTMSTESYLALANNHQGEERQNLLIMAAGRAVYDGQWQQASNILAQTEDLSPAQSSEKNILLAKIALVRKGAKEAIAKLAHVDQSNIPRFYQILYHDVLAKAYAATGKAPYVVAQRIKLERLLPDEASRMNNRRNLWLTLTKLPLAELDTLALEAKDGSTLQGWAQLALVARQNTASQRNLFTEVEQWQNTFPSHPANALLPSPLAAVKPYLYKTPSNIALLLPLSGPLSGPGNAIKEGFTAAHAASNFNDKVTIRVYDTATNDAAALYQQALKEGADYVVGPLVKNDVIKVAQLDHPVPTLFLNDVDNNLGENAYNFGLSFTNEARQVAVKARKAGLKRALIIAPSGSWGDEIVNAFAAQWQGFGGNVVEKLSYDNNTNLNYAVRDFLHVSEKVAEEKQIKPLPGEEVILTPKRREDFDMIFLLAYPSKARQIMPLLKYYFAGDVPVYATSSVYGGSTNTMRDRDLDGVIFCDMPWVFTNQLASKNWPEQFNSYNRLYAIGVDSYALSRQLNQLFLFPAMGINDKSGVLYLNKTKQVARVLAWGRFRGGVAHMTEDSV